MPTKPVHAYTRTRTCMDMNGYVYFAIFFRTKLISLRLRTMSSVTKIRAPGWNFLRAGRGRLSSPIVMFSHMGWMTTYAYFDLSTDDICPRIMNKILEDYGKACGESYILHTYIYTHLCTEAFPTITLYTSIYIYIRSPMSTIWWRSHKGNIHEYRQLENIY
jgi:hypothetical protein